jgi:hypothetical protein
MPTLSASALGNGGHASFCPTYGRQLICHARKRIFLRQPATRWHDGQITQNLSSLLRKNIPLNAQGKSVA